MSLIRTTTGNCVPTSRMFKHWIKTFTVWSCLGASSKSSRKTSLTLIKHQTIALPTLTSVIANSLVVCRRIAHPVVITPVIKAHFQATFGVTSLSSLALLRVAGDSLNVRLIPIQINVLCFTSYIFIVTGCIRPETLDRLNSNDGGGQYDSAGGDGGQGNPQGSACLGLVALGSIFQTFFELLTSIHGF